MAAATTWNIRVRLPNASAPATFPVKPEDPISVLEALVTSDPAVAGSATHGVTIMSGIPPRLLQPDATIQAVLKNNEIVIARIRGASDVVSRAAPGQSMIPASDGKVVEITSAAMLKQLLAAKPKVVVDFYADWCGPCKALAPELAKMAATMRDITFCKVDVDAQQELAESYRIKAMPTIVFHKDGRPVKEVQGADLRGIDAAAKAL